MGCEKFANNVKRSLQNVYKIQKEKKKYRIRETPTLSTDADSRTATIFFKEVA